MRKRLLILGCSLLLSLFVGSSPIAAQEHLTLGISQMVALAISNNFQFKKTNYQLENTRLEARKMEAENLFNKSTISDLQKEILLLNQLNQFQSEKDKLLIQIVDDYFQLLITEQDIKSKGKSVELERIVLTEVEKQVEAGYSVGIDLLQQGNEYYDALFSYQESKLGYQQLLIEIKNRLGIDHDGDIELSDLSIPEFPETQLKTLLEKAQENSITLKSFGIEINQAEKELEAANASDLPEIEILKLKNNLGIARLDKSLAEQDLNYQVESQWLNYNQASNDIIISQRSLQQMKENQEIIKKQVQAGLRSKEEEISSTIGVLDARSRLISSVQQTYQAYLELQRMMGTLDEGDLK